MMILRYIAALLLILAGLLHVLSFFNDLQDANALLMLAFGILYSTIAILLLLNLKIAPALAIIFPLIGMGSGVFVIGLRHLNTMLVIMFTIDLLVVLIGTALFCQKTK